MQIGIDVGATKIESVVLDEKGNESNRERTDCPKDYLQIIKTIKEINKKFCVILTSGAGDLPASTCQREG